MNGVGRVLGVTWDLDGGLWLTEPMVVLMVGVLVYVALGWAHRFISAGARAPLTRDQAEAMRAELAAAACAAAASLVGRGRHPSKRRSPVARGRDHRRERTNAPFPRRQEWGVRVGEGRERVRQPVGGG